MKPTVAVAAFALASFAVAGTAQSAGRPDLRIAFLVDPPSEATQFSTAVKVVNAGTAKADKPSKVTFFLSKYGNSRDIVLGSVPTPRLRAGSSSLRGIRLDIPHEKPGEYNLVACADDLKNVHESRERNNCIGSAWTVTIPPPGEQP